MTDRVDKKILILCAYILKRMPEMELGGCLKNGPEDRRQAEREDKGQDERDGASAINEATASRRLSEDDSTLNQKW